MRPLGRTAALLLALGCSGPAKAQNPAGGPAATPAPSWAGDLDTRSMLLGDIGGLRTALDRSGIAFGLASSEEILGIPVGGANRHSIYEGVIQASVGADLSKTFGWQGALFNVSAYQIHGQGSTLGTLGAFSIISTIEAEPSTRLNEIWLQQSFFDGRLDIKLGQQSADFEFITSEYQDLFINSGFGWPTLPAVVLPSGGPAYPLPTPGIRLRAKPTDAVTTLLGVFNGSPAGLRPGDPQKIDGSGTNFDLSSGVLAIGEAQYEMNGGEHPSGLRGTFKLGGWYNSVRFADALYAHGDTLLSPGVLLGIPRSFRGNWSLYGTLDQLVYRPSADSDGGLAVSARAMGAPSDRNLIDLFLQGSLTYKGAFGRPNDLMGLGVEWARVSPRARRGDAMAGLPVRTAETVIEATYQAQVAPWWQLQPDAQVLFRPGGGILDPDAPTRRIGTTAVLGLRSTVTF